MSRVGKMPIPLPDGVTVTITDRHVAVKGPKGALEYTIPSGITVAQEDGDLRLGCPDDASANLRALYGLARSLVNNMVVGVSAGFTKELEIQGVGYKAEVRPYGLELSLGFSHTIEYKAPDGITCSVAGNVVKVEGIDKQVVGQVASEIRGFRPPEPYKGKGVRYVGEQVRRKAGKTAAK